MKYTLIILLACAPLTGLTAWSGFGLLDRQAAPPKSNLVDSQKALDLAEQAQRRAEGDGSAADEWVQLEVFDPPRHDHELVEGKTVNASAVVAAWRRAQETNKLVVEVGEAVAASVVATDDPIRKVTEQLTALQKFAEQKRRDPANVEGAERIFLVLDRYIEQLKREKQSLEAQAKIDAALRSATSCLNTASQGAAKECLRILDEEPLKSANDKGTRDKIDNLRKVAVYRRDCQELLDRRPKMPADEKLLGEYDEFLTNHPEAPKHPDVVDHEKDARDHEKVLRRRAELHAVIALEDLESSADLQTLLIRAADLVIESRANPDVRGHVRTRVFKWLDKQNGSGKLTASDWFAGRQEGLLKDGRRFIEFFTERSDVKKWRYWKTAEGRAKKDPPRGDGEFNDDDFVNGQTPRKPKYVQLADAYNDEREKLNKESHLKERWTAFGKRCDEMQKIFRDYRQDHAQANNEGDEDCREWAFSSQSEAAREIVRQWDRYRSIFEK